MELEFNFADYDIPGYRYVIHCPHKWQADILEAELNNRGLFLVGGQQYDGTIWDRYKVDTCYDFVHGTFGRYSTYEKDKRTVVFEFADCKFITPRDDWNARDEILL